MTNKKKIIFYIFMIALINISLCFGMSLFKKPQYYLASFEGKVIDADTKEPIEGAVVLIVYNKSTPSIAGSNTYEVDAQETLTDKNGEFKIPSKIVQSEKVRGRPRGKVIIFKPGHGTLRHKRAQAVGENKSWPPPEKYIVYEIPKLNTIKERKRNARMRSYDEIPYEKRKLYINTINEECRSLGLPLMHIPDEERQK